MTSNCNLCPDLPPLLFLIMYVCYVSSEPILCLDCPALLTFWVLLCECYIYCVCTWCGAHATAHVWDHRTIYGAGFFLPPWPVFQGWNQTDWLYSKYSTYLAILPAPPSAILKEETVLLAGMPLPWTLTDGIWTNFSTSSSQNHTGARNFIFLFLAISVSLCRWVFQYRIKVWNSLWSPSPKQFWNPCPWPQCQRGIPECTHERRTGTAWERTARLV